VKVLLFIGILLLLASCKYSTQDIYVDGLVYKKNDSSFFSGTLEISEEKTYYFQKFKFGKPFGITEIRSNNDNKILFVGEYLDAKWMDEILRAEDTNLECQLISLYEGDISKLNFVGYTLNIIDFNCNGIKDVKLQYLLINKIVQKIKVFYNYDFTLNLSVRVIPSYFQPTKEVYCRYKLDKYSVKLIDSGSIVHSY
jgi:hypothetical protein